MHDLERVCNHLILLTGSRVRLSADIDDVLGGHRVLIGPRRSTAELERLFTVVKATQTERQSRVLARLDGDLSDPAWQTSHPGLEDIILAYMSEAEALTAAMLIAAAGLTAAGCGQTAATTTAETTATRVPAPAVPVLSWKPCDGGFQCATAHVPLNYRDPRGAQISIAVISHRATSPGRNLGWLFFNGGEPEPQLSTFSRVYPILPAAWRERYNINTFDLRGMGYSTQVRCYPTEAARDKAMGEVPDGFPVGKAQEADYERESRTGERG